MSSTAEIEHIDFAPNWENFQSGNLKEETHVWRVNISKSMPWIRDKKHLLSREESEKFGRIFRKGDKDLFLAGKVVAKLLCADYLNCPPEEVEFSKSENQKPFIKGWEGLHFNIAHSGDWAVLIFSVLPCGIDLEKIDPDFGYSEIMDISFHKSEINYVNNAPDARMEFYRLWTNKESILKAVGTGIIENLSDLNALPGVKTLPDNLISSKNSGWQTKNFNWEGEYSMSISYQNSLSTVKFFEFALP